MAFQLTEFYVHDLHNIKGHAVHLRLEDNRLVLVGENGTGKTTVISLLYAFLSRQWSRLRAYRFSELGATINGQPLQLSREVLKSGRGERYHDLSDELTRRLMYVINDFGADRIRQDVRLIRRVADLAGVPTTLVRDFIQGREFEQLPLLGAEDRSKLHELGERLAGLITERVLYLPTYRRIEQDLRSLFPDADESWVHRRLSRRRQRDYIELVEFGMEDVEQDIERKMEALKDNVRTGLNNLTVLYLRDVINGEYRSIDAGSIETSELQSIEWMVDKIDERMLPGSEKARLHDIVLKIQSAQSVDDEERVIALFLLKLLDLHRQQQAAESTVRTFKEICNKYLVGKHIRYDSNDFTVQVFLGKEDENTTLDPSQRVELKKLSSGEKQIVSLFSHLLLAGGDGYFALIDEPELSLSVPWQQSLLPDMLSTGRCAGLVAVTHSPFIFDNELDRYSHNISEFFA